MYVAFEKMADRSRIWVYQADRTITSQEAVLIEKELRSFCEEWVAHGDPLTTSYSMERNRFIILAVDEGEGGASGCSIDGSVRMLKSIQKTIGIDFLSRSSVPFLIGSEIRFIPVKELKQSFTSGILGLDTPTFHLLAETKGAWGSGGIVEAKTTWMAQYLPKATVS